MNKTLILLLGETPHDAVRWALMGDNEVLRAGEVASVQELPQIGQFKEPPRQIAAMIRGECIAMRALPTPPRSQNQFRAAAGFLLEDELAENLDNIHLAVARHPGGSGLSLAIKKSVLDEWLSALGEVGYAPDVASPDYAVLPLKSGRMTLIEYSDRIVCASGLSGFAIDRPQADELVATLAEDDAIEEIVVYGNRTAETVERDGVTVDWRGPADAATLFAILGEGIARAPNLLQGAYRKKTDWRGVAGPWRRTGMFAAAALAAILVLNIASIFRDLTIADRLREETLELHAAAFPDAAGVDPRSYARQVLASGGARPAFLLISDALAESTNADGGVQIDRIRFNGSRGEYSVNMRFSDIGQIEALKRSLESRGLSATESGGVRRSGNVYLGELRVGLT